MNCVPLPGRFLGIETMLSNARGNFHFTWPRLGVGLQARDC